MGAHGNTQVVEVSWKANSGARGLGDKKGWLYLVCSCLLLRASGLSIVVF